MSEPLEPMGEDLTLGEELEYYIENIPKMEPLQKIATLDRLVVMAVNPPLVAGSPDLQFTIDCIDVIYAELSADFMANQVRMASAQALGKIPHPHAYEYLHSVFEYPIPTRPKYFKEVRLTALESVISTYERLYGDVDKASPLSKAWGDQAAWHKIEDLILEISENDELEVKDRAIEYLDKINNG